MVFDISSFGIAESSLPNDWKTDRIGLIADINPEQVGRAYPHSTIAYLDIGNVASGSIGQPETMPIHNAPSRAKRLVRSEDIIISTVRPGNRAYAFMRETPDNLVVSTGFAVLRAKDSVNPRFLYHLVTSKPLIEYWASIADEKSAYPSINPSDIAECVVPIPPLLEQNAIAHILGTLDEKIDLNRRINQTLEAMAQAIFKSWFVDFDPVKAKIAAIEQGQDPLRAAMRAISGKTDTELDQMPREHHDQLAATATLFPDEMEESELGDIPKGWSAVPFGSLLLHTIGGDWGKEVPDTVNDTRVAIIRGTDIPDLELAQSNRVPFRYTNQKKLATRRLQIGDIVLEVSGGSKDQPTGRSFRMTANALREFDCPVEPASFCRLLRPFSLEIGAVLGLHLSYIYQQGKTWEYQNQSTGIANFQTSHFLETELVASPTNSVTDVFFRIVNPLLERRHDVQGRKLTTLRDTLLPKLLSGELSVAPLEKQGVLP